jgi:hypothetical protein
MPYTDQYQVAGCDARPPQHAMFRVPTALFHLWEHGAPGAKPLRLVEGCTLVLHPLLRKRPRTISPVVSPVGSRLQIVPAQ